MRRHLISFALVVVLAGGWSAGGCSDSTVDGDADGEPTPTATGTADRSPTPSNTAEPPGSSDTVRPGPWSGEDSALIVTASGATATFECASGAITEPLRLDAAGRFDLAGWFAAESGGPGTTDTPEPLTLPARYRGRVVDSQMTLSLVLTDSGTRHGPFRLQLGGTAAPEQCL